jgi:hypothetical protein
VRNYAKLAAKVRKNISRNNKTLNGNAEYAIA